jgi:hypothetical protein
MKIHAGLFAVFALFFIPINHVQAQVNPGNDPVMWDYVDPTQFWVILDHLRNY